MKQTIVDTSHDEMERGCVLKESRTIKAFLVDEQCHRRREVGWTDAQYCCQRLCQWKQQFVCKRENCEFKQKGALIREKNASEYPYA
jgi:hypothetical protein